MRGSWKIYKSLVILMRLNLLVNNRYVTWNSTRLKLYDSLKTIIAKNNNNEMNIFMPKLMLKMLKLLSFVHMYGVELLSFISPSLVTTFSFYALKWPSVMQKRQKITSINHGRDYVEPSFMAMISFDFITKYIVQQLKYLQNVSNYLVNFS